MNNQEAIRHLFIKGLINRKLFDSLIKKAEKLKVKQAKELRQAEVNDVVEAHLESLTPGDLFKHRTVWEAVGRDEFTRDEVLTSLQAHKENFLVEQVRKGPNNFQVFWKVAQVDEVEETDEEAS
jgi:hypothetical protein